MNQLTPAKQRFGNWPDGSAWLHLLWSPRPGHPWGALVMILEVVGIRETWECHVEMPYWMGRNAIKQFQRIPSAVCSLDGVAIPLDVTACEWLAKNEGIRADSQNTGCRAVNEFPANPNIA